jgi:uncharacterized protein (TIGR03435 family)
MLQNLLAERFHLVLHHETRNFAAYELVVDKGGPKLGGLAAGDDAPGTPGPRVSPNGANATAGNITMKEQTMADLAQRLGMALYSAQVIQEQNPDLPIPRVVDKTGLTGKYTFSLDYSPPGLLASPDSPASDLQDLFVALRERLGLRLNKTKSAPWMWSSSTARTVSPPQTN